ncbi:ABC transporter permease [Aquimarina algiphila]|uniref:ABC transporter permease n=1 Tax=Aquimarina algiphila TaxID=2047982 RepID=UPI0024914C26|nr:ABC transporter permease [Aquimarina algiphila]
MLRHHFILYIRSIKRYKASFFINIIGLSTALTCSILIYLWVNDELHKDKFHENSDHIFHLMELAEFPQVTKVGSTTSGNIAPLMLAEMPEINMATQVVKYPQNATLSIEDKSIKGDGHYVSKDFFKIFSFPIIKEDKNDIWSNTNTIFVSETIATTLFGSVEDAMGQNIEFQKEKEYTVAGVFEDVPQRSSERFDFVLSYEEKALSQTNLLHWGSQSTYVYLSMKPGTDIVAFNDKIHDFIRKKTNRGQSYRTPFLKKYTDEYLYGSYENGVEAGGRITYVKLFSIIALFILVIACINFMNMSTAKASRRLKEIGIKKAIGANRKTLIFQYLTEAVGIAFIALFLAMIFVTLLLPEFNQITGKQLSMTISSGFVLALLGITLFTGLLSGSYPALYLSGFRPATILKGKLNTSVGEVWTRKGLVIIQYTVSIVLIVSVLIVHKQIEYIQNKNLGYTKEQIIHFSREGKTLDNNHIDTFLAELKNIPGVADASSTRNAMTGDGWGVGGFDWEGKDPNDYTQFQNMIAYYGLIEMLDIEILAGRSFSKDFSEENTKVILNESAIKRMQLKDPVGKFIGFRNKKREIIGVIKDFHFESLHEDIKPMIVNLWPERLTKFMVKIEVGKEQETLASLQDFYEKYNPGFLFDYMFLDENYQELYVAEQRVSKLSRYFAVLAIIISCLGLFGLVSFTAERRKKEIGIRKVLGDSSAHISFLLSKEFVKLVLVAIVIGLPISYMLINNWLSGFAYKTGLNLWYFFTAGVLVLIVTIFTVSTQTMIAANRNPVDALRDE